MEHLRRCSVRRSRGFDLKAEAKVLDDYKPDDWHRLTVARRLVELRARLHRPVTTVSTSEYWDTHRMVRALAKQNGESSHRASSRDLEERAARPTMMSSSEFQSRRDVEGADTMPRAGDRSAAFPTC